MGSLRNYLVKGFDSIQSGIIIGIVTYLVLFLVLRVIPSRSKDKRMNLSELLLTCCCTCILSLTGIFALDFKTFEGFSHISNIGLIPFLGGSVVPIFLNFLLFVPFGFLFQFVFSKLNWKKVFFAGLAFSSCIELLQLYGGRYAELEDILLNSAGALAGCLFHNCLMDGKTNIRKSILSIALLLSAIVLLFGTLYSICGRTQEEPENSIANIADSIESCHFIHDGEYLDFSAVDYELNTLTSTLANGGGHIWEIEPVTADVFCSENYYMEIHLKEPQSITVSNDGKLVIDAADRLLYDTTNNVLY